MGAARLHTLPVRSTKAHSQMPNKCEYAGGRERRAEAGDAGAEGAGEQSWGSGVWQEHRTFNQNALERARTIPEPESGNLETT